MKYIWMIFGFLFCGIGIIGIFLPILPTTPFLLLASVCFTKGSERIHHWFKNTQLYQNHLADFKKDRTMTRKTKLCILIPVSILLMLAFFMMENRYGRITILILLAIKYYIFLFQIQTKPE